MIYGIGIDIVRTARMKETVEKWGQRFLDRVFTEEEVSYSYAKKDPYPSLSVRFAAKEALIKALPQLPGFSMTDVGVRMTDSGKPVLEVRGGTAETIRQMGVKNIHLSLSHEKEYSVASVVIEGGQ